MILLLQSLQNMECIWPREANPKQQSALLLTAIPLWFCLSQHWGSKLSFQLSTPIITQDTRHWLQKFIYFLFKTWMGKCTQTPFFPHPFLPLRRAVCFFIWPYERLGKLFQQYSDKGSPRFLRDIAKGRRKKKQTTKTSQPATKLLDVLFNNFWAEHQILSTN